MSLTTATYASWWVVVLLVALLVPQAIVLARLSRDRPERCPLVPVAGFVLWLVVALLA